MKLAGVSYNLGFRVRFLGTKGVCRNVCAWKAFRRLGNRFLGC